MGVDIQTYRAKIGTYRHSCGTDVATCVIVINFSQCLKYIGSVLFISIILMMAGIESNPGPKDFVPSKIPSSTLEPSKLFIAGLPSNVTEETLTLFFENERSQGGEVVLQVSINTENQTAVVEFENPEAVSTVLQKRPIIISGKEVEVSLFDLQKHQSPTLESSKLFVAKLPLNVTEETLTMIFENVKRQGGGDVLNVTIDTENQTAVVEFENPKAVSTVLQKRPIVISGKEVECDVFDLQKHQSPILERSKLFVAGLPLNVTEEILTMFFENEKRQGGGVILQVIHNTENQTAVVEFENPKAVSTVLQKRPIEISGKEVECDVFDLQKHQSPTLESSKLFVAKLPLNVTEETLTMFFENVKRQGGGDVLNVSIDTENQTAVVEFENPKAVSTVLQKRPIVISGKEVKCNVFDLQKHQSPILEHSKLFVAGLPLNVTEEILTMFFENEKRQGGGVVLQVIHNTENQTAVVEFENPKAVSTVLQKRPIKISGKEVECDVFDLQKHQSPTLEHSKLFVAGLPLNVTEEILTMFFENEKRQGGGVVLQVIHNTENQTAVVEFENPKAVSTVLQKRPIKISGKEVECDVFDLQKHQSPTLESSKLFVAKLPLNVTEETLTMFFENVKRQGGGAVLNVTIDTKNQTAVVEFENPKAVSTVLQKRPIVISGKEVECDVFDLQKHQSPILERSKLFVAGLPLNVTEEILTMFFENEKRQGGGVVLQVIHNTENQTAVVEFENPKAVSTVLQKRPIVISGKEVKCDVFDLQKQQSPTLEPTKLFVAGLPSNITEETLAMFFENERRQGGGVVLNVTIDTENQTAVVQFKNPKEFQRSVSKKNKTIAKKCPLNNYTMGEQKFLEIVFNIAAVKTVLQKRPITILGKVVQVGVFDMPSITHQRNETKVKRAAIRTTTEEGMEEHSGKKDLPILCEQISTDGQTIESEAPDNKKIRAQTGSGTEQRRRKNDMKILCEQGSDDGQSIESVTRDNEKIKTQTERGSEQHSGKSDTQICEQGNDDGQSIESVTMDSKDMPSITHQRNETKVKRAAIRTTTEEGMEEHSGKKDLPILCEQISTDGQTIESEAPDNKEIRAQTGSGTEQRRRKNDTKILCEQGSDDGQSIESVTRDNEKIKTQTERGSEQHSGKSDMQICEQGNDDGQSIESVTMDSKDMPSITHQRNETKVKRAAIRTTTEEGMEEHSGKKDLPILCEQISTDGQTIESEVPDNKEIRAQTGSGTEQRRQKNDTKILCEQGSDDGQSIESVTRDNEKIKTQTERGSEQHSGKSDMQICEQGNDDGQSIESVTMDSKDMPSITHQRNETKVKRAAIRTTTEEGMEEHSGKKDLPILCEQISTDGQTIESEVPDNKEIRAQTGSGTEQRRQKNDTKILCEQGSDDGQSIESVTRDNEKIKTQTERGSEQHSGKSDMQICEQGNDDGQSIESVTMDSKDMPSITHQRNETKVKRAAIRTTTEEGMEEHSGKKDLPILCEQISTDGQTIESEVPDNKEIRAQTGSGTEQRRQKNDTKILCVQGSDDGQSIESVTRDNESLPPLPCQRNRGDDTEIRVPTKGGMAQCMGDNGMQIVYEQSSDADQTQEMMNQNNEEGVKNQKFPLLKDLKDVFDKNSDDDQTRMIAMKEFKDILRKLGLVEKYPAKITMNDVIAINPADAAEYDKQVIPLTDVPWVMLKRLMSAHSEARDISAKSGNTEEKHFDFSVSNLEVEEHENESLSPLDIFTVVFQCCDPFLKQILFQKLYLCKMAVPFLYKTLNQDCSHQVLSIWPLRSLTIESKLKSFDSSVENSETDVLNFSSKIITFCRFGRPRYSKSKLLNYLLTSEGSKTFFNIDCPSGMTPRHISGGQVEMFWLPLVGSKIDRFKDPMTFMNMRGDISEHFSSETCSFIAKIADAISIVTDISCIQNQSNMLKRVLSNFPSAILILANPLDAQDRKLVSNFEKDIRSLGTVANFRVLCTHRGTTEQNVVDMVKYISYHIENHLKSRELRSIRQRLTTAISSYVTSDEDDPDCRHGKLNAEKLLKLMKSDGKKPEEWKQILTPVHSKYSKCLGQLKKKRERVKDLGEGECIDREIADIRKKQTKTITKATKQFICTLISNPESSTKLQFFLRWLHYFIEREKGGILPKLILKSHNAWEKLEIIKSNKEANAEDIKKQEEFLTQLENEIENASFSVEHFFREIGHIYEAILELNLNALDFELPSLNTTAEIVGHIVAKGHQLELIDGESFYMPFKWIQEVMKHVENITKSCKVMVLSVLGLQSSGKSTLLNTMFGSQFSTRTGRCTRGIHVQLLPTKVSNIKRRPSHFDYVVVVDTEGLRSPELSNVQHEHDNELATVITGLGDVTILNIMGENTNEIKDILQVIVHAFLRLKMTNRSLDSKKSCTFIHQNVTDISASENMRKGLSKLLQTLDEMTKESANSEGMLDITAFNQVIEFDIKSQVWYLKNLWQGNPPMARVNTEYSELVVDIKCNILTKAMSMNNKSYKSFGDLIEQAHSLWKGVMNEDFVFSFRNSLEIRAYIEMDKVVQENLWQLESSTRDSLVKKSEGRFAYCSKKENLQTVKDDLFRELKEFLHEEKMKVEGKIANYFESNKYKDLTIQWKTTQQVRIDTLCQQLEMIIFEQVKKNYTKRSIEILTVSNHEKHEEKLRLRSMEEAAANKGKQLTQNQIDNLFENIWSSFIENIDTTSVQFSDLHRKNMKETFIDCLKDMFQKNSPILKELLEESSRLAPLQNLSKLSGSYKKIGIDFNKDVSIIQKKQSVGSQLLDWMTGKGVKKLVISQVENILRNIDEIIESLCRVNDEITEMHVKKLMHNIKKSIDDMIFYPHTLGLKPTFKVKVFIHICRHAHDVYEKHNENYIRTQGIAIRLQQYKKQQKISFEAHLSNRNAEDVAAHLFSNVVEVHVKEWTLTNMSNKMMDELHAHLPSIKNRVIVEICKSLVEKNEFPDFVRYLRSPSGYACHWLREKARHYLFCKEPGIYFLTTKTLVTDAFNKARSCLEQLKTEHGSSSARSIESFVDEFYLIAKKNQLSIKCESFRNVRKEYIMVENMQYLTDAITANMLQAKDRVLEEFKLVTQYTVRWENDNPIETTIQKIWGCEEKCPFCREPCAKNQDHGEDVHYCIQHRPTCCIGIHQIKTQKGSLTACNFDVNSDLTHMCGVFDFVCDPNNKESDKQCSKSPHKYRDYKTFYHNWDIPPSSAMHESSKFWMWFVATYQKQLCEYYGYTLDDIPSSWKEIQQKEAVDSLENAYSVSTR